MASCKASSTLAYHAVKHDRQKSFRQATFKQMTDAMAGLVVLLSSQFLGFDFGTGHCYIEVGPFDGMESANGDYFRVAYPYDWPDQERYDFFWAAQMGEADPFQNFNYPK
jgi:hypothetical protein